MERSLPQLPHPQRWALLVAVALGSAGALAAGGALGWRGVGVWVLALGLGLALSHGGFGFAAGYRGVLAGTSSRQVRAQVIAVAVVILLGQPLVSAGGLGGLPVRGFEAEIGLELVLGAFVFGIGMQLANGCASGTLYSIGDGSGRMVIVLAAMVAGASIAALSFPAWEGLPALPALSLPRSLGLLPAVLLQGAILAGLWWGLNQLDRWRGTKAEPLFTPMPSSAWWRGPWPQGWSALVLALLAILVMLVAGRPWNVTQAFALWGGWGVEASGLDDPYFWPYWDHPLRVELLPRAFWADITSVMALGVMAGAFLAATSGGRWHLRWPTSFGGLASAVLGGLLTGFGGILALGCNIGAFLAGVASGSAHGWVWLLAALPGCAVGLWLRPWFGLEPARATARHSS
ncbi:MAG: YeeE/YedE family protein [Alphaproteobacteria bacterium]|nr:YeeE/YedE family protein [Alphaproteobacteria bacterium]